MQDIKQVHEGWVSNFTSKARGTGKIKQKPEKLKLGNVNGKGVRLEGTIDGFDATELNVVDDQHGWRLQAQVWTMATGGATFEKEMKTFIKSFRIKKK
jgi:hypothetical protein